MENEAKAAKAELAARKTESAQWLSELNSLNLTMDRKLTDSTFSPFLLSDSDANDSPYVI